MKFKKTVTKSSQIFLFSTVAVFSLNSSVVYGKGSRKIVRESSASLQGPSVAAPRKKVDALAAQPQVSPTAPESIAIAGVPMQPLPSTGVGLPSTQIPQNQILLPTTLSPVPIAPAVTPLLAMALLSMLAQQNFSSSTPTAPAPAPAPSLSSSPSPLLEASDSDKVSQETASDLAENITEEVAPPDNAKDTQAAIDTPPSRDSADAVGDEPIPETTVATSEVAKTVPNASEALIPKTGKTEAPANPNQCFNYSSAGNRLGKSAGALSIGSGACNGEVIAMDYIITNSHCMEGHRGTVRAAFGLGAGESKRAFECQGIAARNPKNQLDYAIIKCPGIGKHFPPVEIANRRPIVGESLQMATHNFTDYGAIDKVVNSGKVLSKNNSEDLGDSMVSSVYGEPGNSGSGMYDKDGKWIGLLWGGLSDDGGKPSFFTPADKIVQDLNRRFPKVAQQIKTDAQVLADCRSSGGAANRAVATAGVK